LHAHLPFLDTSTAGVLLGPDQMQPSSGTPPLVICVLLNTFAACRSGLLVHITALFWSWMTSWPALDTW
jgi:hypothetical protein